MNCRRLRSLQISVRRRLQHVAACRAWVFNAENTQRSENACVIGWPTYPRQLRCQAFSMVIGPGSALDLIKVSISFSTAIQRGLVRPGTNPKGRK